MDLQSKYKEHIYNLIPNFKYLHDKNINVNIELQTMYVPYVGKYIIVI